MTAPAPTYRSDASTAYAHNYAYLADELDKLDALLRLRVAAFRQAQQRQPASGSHPLYIAEEDIDRLLNPAAAPATEAPDEAALRRHLDALQLRIEARVQASLAEGVFLALPHLAHLFGLSGFEVQVVLLCLAPELRRSYDLLYAYLQDDITRKRPSIDLVLQVLCETENEAWEARAVLTAQSPLFRAGLLHRVEDVQSPSGSSGLAVFLQLDPRIVQFLLGHRTTDERLASLVRLQAAAMLPREPSPEAAALAEFVRHHFEGAQVRRSVLHLSGPTGVGRASLAQAVCSALGLPMLRLDVRRLPSEAGEAEERLRLVFRESLLLQAPLYLGQAEALLKEAPLQLALKHAAEAYGWLTFLATEKPWAHPGLFEETLFYSLALPMPGVPAREQAWRQALQRRLPDADADALAPRLAQRFRLTPGRIGEAVAALADRHAVRGPAPVSFETLAAVCRAEGTHDLRSLATKIEPGAGWDDLVLPEEKQEQLREICSQVRHRYQVYERWGFEAKLPRGKGLSALFTGPPGTGKTMAADVLAHDLQLDLYKIDLARIVSKYIGETEKNLGRIFEEAEHSHAILFFDEADALFGKRTEISDAHDRYANIETSYLLQKMEEYDGMVILASNLRENMDEAFLRRLRFVVEFPFPDAAYRERIWRNHFPAQAPLAEDIDYTMLAEGVQVAGGNIKNIALHAAFCAAANGCVIGMEHILQGVRREYEKIGKLWDAQRFTRMKSKP